MKTNNNTNNLKKLLTLVLTLCMVLTLLPALSTKASAVVTLTETLGLAVGTEVGDPAALTTAGYFYWDGDHTLTLNSVEIRKGDNMVYVASPTEDTIINLIGDSVIRGTSVGYSNFYTDTIIQGSGLLSCYADNGSAFMAENLTVTGGAALYATSYGLAGSSPQAGLGQCGITCDSGMVKMSSTASDAGLGIAKTGTEFKLISVTTPYEMTYFAVGDTINPARTMYIGPVERSRTVGITLGANMSRSSGGALSQTVSGTIDPVVITANTGYKFPTNYTSRLGANGISVMLDSDSQITVSGTPTANTSLALPAATIRSYTLTLQKNDKITGVSASGTGVTGSFPTYTVPYKTNVTVTATPVTTSGDSQYKFYRWLSGAETKSDIASYTFPWDFTGNITLKAEGVGGVKASGRATVAPAALQPAKTATVTLGGTPDEGTHSVSLVSGTTTIALTKGSGNSYTTSLPAADTNTYEVWVDGIKTDKTVKVTALTATVTMAKFDCAIQKDGVAWNNSGHSVELRRDGVGYPTGSVLPTSGVSYERWVDGVKFGSNLSADAATGFYTVTFKDGETAYGGSTPFKPQVILDCGKATEPTATPVKEGMTFLGWNTTGNEAQDLFNFATETISATKPLKAVWQENSTCEARWVTNGETFYGTLTEALSTAITSGDHIYVQNNSDIPGGTLESGVTLGMDAPDLTITNSGTFTNEGAILNNGSITGSITNNGTITNVVVSGVVTSGKLGTVTNSGSITGGTLEAMTNSGTVINAVIAAIPQNIGTLDGCRIGSGTGIVGVIRGSTYAGNGVTFGSGATFTDATVSLKGNGSEGSGMNSATVFAGLMDIDGAGNSKLKANVVFRDSVTFDRGGALNLDGHSILGANGSDGAAGGNGVTPIKVTGIYALNINGPGSILGGSGGDATGTGNGGDGGNGVDASGSGRGSVIIGEGVSVSGGNGGTGSGSGNHGGTGGDGVIGSDNENDYIIVNGTAQGGNGGPGINQATGGAGGNGVSAAIVHSANGQLIGGDPGNGRYGDPTDEASAGTDGTVAGQPKSAAQYTWVVGFSATRLSATNSSLPANQIVPEAAGGSYSSTLSVNPAGNQYISRPEAITVKMGSRTLTAGEGKDYTYDKDTGLFTLLLGNADISANISITANGVVPNEVDIAAVEGNTDTAKQLKDALEAEIKRINIKENVTLSEYATVLENSVVYVDEGVTLTIAIGKQFAVVGAVVVNGTFVGSEMVAPGGALLETPEGVWNDSSKSDFIYVHKGSTTYKCGSIIATSTNTGYLYIRNEWIGKEIKLAQYDRLRNLSSPEQTIDLSEVPAKPAAPSSSKFKLTQPGSAEATGKVECLPVAESEPAVTYQYSINNGKTWVEITSGNPLSSIPQGTDVFLRFPAGIDPETSASIPASQILVFRVNVYTPPTPSSGGGATTTKVPVIVDGVEYNIGTAKTSGGVTTVTVDQTALQKQLDAASETVVVPVTPGRNADTVVAQFVVANVDEMAEKEMTLSVQVDNVSYDMRAIAIDTDAVMKELGATDPTKVPISVTIKKLSGDDVKLESGELLLPPVSFTVTASYGGKTVEVEVFEKYVQRVIEVPNGVDASKITTAVVVENGKQRHVPTEVFQKDGKWYARINSLTNSVYALINNEKSFTDADGKWFEAVVTEMASRGIIDGRNEATFDGEASITRAEFAALVVRALGLPENGDGSVFTDVESGAWYYGAVGKAYEYKLIEGRGNGIFDPQANITRQEAMAMVHRAAAITEFAGATGTLAAFSDADSISAWALADAQWNVGSGLIQGSNGLISGQSIITRGETATIILRLLQKSGLVDVRIQA